MHTPDSAGVKLKDFYQAELSALRNEAVEFAVKYPEAAGALGMGPNKGPAADPQVELLMQSFAFLTGRLQYQMEQDQAALPNALLGLLYPHLEAPVPSMLIAEIAVKPDGANFAKEQLLARGRYVSAPAANELGQKIDCRFRTCYDTPLLPLAVDNIEVLPASKYAFLKNEGRIQSVLRVRVRAEGAGTLQAQGQERLRFYIDNAEQNAYALYEALVLNLTGIAVHLPQQDEEAPQVRSLPVEALRWLGFDDSEAILEANPHTHPGYRLLQEFFAFPEKFLFFEVEKLDLTGAQDSFELLFLLDMPADKTLAFTPQALRLNCVPLVNLFSQRIDPMALDHTQYEYRLQADLENHRHCEIYALQALESIRPDGSRRPIVPYFAMDDFQRMEQQDYFYIARRERSQAAGVAGSEVYVSFLDAQFDIAQPADETIGGKALCTNRRLPEKLMAGSRLYLEGAGPVKDIRVLNRPTPHQTPAQIGARPWALVSQLALNHLSLSDRPEALAALKDILLLHAGPNKKRALKQIDGISAMRCRGVVRHVGKDGWRGFVRGSHVRLEMDRNHFDDASPVLFCSVLRHFFALYATVNMLVEVSLETQDIKGNQQWQPLAGARTVL